jgi:hypothetical protein
MCRSRSFLIQSNLRLLIDFSVLICIGDVQDVRYASGIADYTYLVISLYCLLMLPLLLLEGEYSSSYSLFHFPTYLLFTTAFENSVVILAKFFAKRKSNSRDILYVAEQPETFSITTSCRAFFALSTPYFRCSAHLKILLLSSLL